MSRPLEGQIALVTGASRGIGKACALALGHAGAQVALCARDVDACRAIAESLPNSKAFPLDLTNDESIAACAEAVARDLGPVDILVNNAGIALSAPMHRTAPGDLRRMMDVNFTGAFLLTQALLPSMLERRRGRVINVASTAGRAGYRYTVAYCASKHALVGMTRALAQEVAHKGICVNAVCPGWTETDMLDASAKSISQHTGRSYEDAVSTLAKMNPMGRLIRPEEVAHWK